MYTKGIVLNGTIFCHIITLFLECIEESATRFCAWCNASSHNNGGDLLVDGAVDLPGADAGGDLPDVAECNTGKVAAPADGHRDAT